MIISFNIEYRTNWGEEVRVTGSIPELGLNDMAKAIPLHTTDGINWNVAIKVADKNITDPISYNYQIWNNGKMIRHEWKDAVRCLYPSNDSERLFKVNDCWKNMPEQQYFYSSAFTESLLIHSQRTKLGKSSQKALLIKAYAPRIHQDFCLGICGNQKQLGNWNPEKALLMSDINFPEWQGLIDAEKISYPLEYKFVLYNKKEKTFDSWENNPNRYVANPQIKKNETFVISDRYVDFNQSPWKAAGVAIPIFSLKTQASFGVGDFGDLKKLIDWVVLTKQKVVQILPINDTTITHTWTDSYPYNSISIYAMHPMYANLRQMGQLKDKEKALFFETKQKELNQLDAIDYEAVNQLKWDYFHLLFEQDGKKTIQSKAFLQFFKENEEWLKPYAVFSYLRDIYHTPNFREWPKHSTYDTKKISKLCEPKAPEYEKIAIYYFIQYHLHLQLLEATSYARHHGVVLKGDIPIGISRNSVEAWTEPHYFNLNGQAGAPPDDFSANGQNWGFPTYNWDVMESDGYRWWMKRFQKMAAYFDAYRIDHILGFFRIWEIPTNAVHGLLGQFVPAMPMSKEEIASYGLNFREEFLEPYIHEYFLEQLFGSHKSYVKQTFLEETTVYERYRMRPEFNTQQKVEAFFNGKTDPDSLWIRDGLYALISDVLFVPDVKDPTQYHPRIAVQHDFIYRSLSDSEKDAFNRLYNHYYYHRHNDFWQQQAMKKLPQLTQSTRMLVCGEDLGMIPNCVAWVMNELRILSLEIQRMPKNPSHEFGHLNEYPYRSVCTISTHDMSTLRGWWKEDTHQTQRYFNDVLGRQGAAPTEATGEICEQIVRNHLYSQSILCILSMQDWLSIDEASRHPEAEAERINVPANPKHYWRYRMHLSIEELIDATALNQKIISLIEQTERNPIK